MYQWRDPETGTTQFSGKPPTWYRSNEKGPRVIVFDNGKVIDDTSIPLGASQKRELRKQAMLKAEEDIREAEARALEAEKIKSALGKGASSISDEEQETADSEEASSDSEKADSQQEATLEALTREEMRAIISELDKMIESAENAESGEGGGMPVQ